MIELEQILSGGDERTALKVVKQLVGLPVENRGSKREVASYSYTDELGAELFQVVRYEPKDFQQRRSNGRGGWIWNVKGVRSVPYRLHKVLEAAQVYIVEGEKDVHTLESWGLTGTCNPGGSGKWRPEFSQYFRGKQVIILPDNDEAGARHTRAVSESLQGIAASTRTLELPGLATKGDVSDWKEMGGTAERLLALLNVAEELPLGDTSIPDLKRFWSNSRGVYLLDSKAKDIWICPPLEVLASVRNFNGEGWGSWLRFRDQEGCERTCVLPNASLVGDGKDAIARLLDLGFRPKRDRKSIELVKDFIYQSKPKRLIRSVHSIGWHDGVFVLPDKCIGPPDRDEVLYNPETTIDHKYRAVGSLDDWRQNVARLCIGNSRLLFAVSAAFAAPLLDIVKAESCGFHFRGLSSTGKTTLLLIAGSVWGGNSQSGFLDTWRATANGMEARAALHHNALLCLDEIGEVRDVDLGDIVYALGNGGGKARMSRNMTSRANTEFKLLFLSSGERSLADVMRTAGSRVRGGQEVRLSEVVADAGAGLGAFEDLHEYSSADQLAKALGRAAKTCYGAAILAYLESIVVRREELEQEIRKYRDIFVQRVPSNSSGEVLRVASSFGIVAFAGELASNIGITGWPPGAAFHAAWTCFRSWLDNRGGGGSLDIESGIAAVRNFILVHGSSRFQSLPNDGKVVNRAGFKEHVEGEWFYFIVPSVFRDEVCTNCDYKEVAKEMSRRGYLRKGEGNHLAPRKRVEGLGNARLFAVLPTLFGDDEKGGTVGTMGTDGASL